MRGHDDLNSYKKILLTPEGFLKAFENEEELN